MPALLLNIKVAAITDVSNPLSKYEFVGLFGSCSVCVHVILNCIHMQKTLMIFLIYKWGFFWVLSVFYRGSKLSLLFMAHSMVVSFLNRGSGSKNK